MVSANDRIENNDLLASIISNNRFGSSYSFYFPNHSKLTLVDLRIGSRFRAYGISSAVVLCPS